MLVFNILVLLNVVALEDVQLALDKVGLIAEHLDLLLVGLDHGERRLNLLELAVHVGGGGVDDAAQPGKRAREFPDGGGSWLVFEGVLRSKAVTYC